MRNHNEDYEQAHRLVLESPKPEVEENLKISHRHDLDSPSHGLLFQVFNIHHHYVNLGSKYE